MKVDSQTGKAWKALTARNARQCFEIDVKGVVLSYDLKKKGYPTTPFYAPFQVDSSWALTDPGAPSCAGFSGGCMLSSDGFNGAVSTVRNCLIRAMKCV